jgi:predicted kinase
MPESNRSEITILLGLPGSGKSTLLKEIEDQYDFICDDYRAGSKDNIGIFENSRCYDELIERLNRGEKCLISDIKFCQESYQREIIEKLKKVLPEFSEAQIRFIAFENNPEKAIKNAIKRNRHTLPTEINHILEFSKSYHIPEDSKILEIINSLEG